ncbi:MAG: hypothetical protein U1E65_29705 [Myxococcota bacterium]
MNRRGAIAVIALAAGVACTDANLFGQKAPTTPDKVAFKGHLCTSDPTEQAFPVKVLFLVDTTIGDSDYINGRGDSLDKVALQFAGPNYSYAVIRYSGIQQSGTACGLRNLTPDGYTKTLDDAIAGVRCADTGNPGRSLINALSLASSYISGDILTTKLGLRSRSKYVIIVHSNGPPSESLENQWCLAQNPQLMDPAECQMAYFQEFCSDVHPPPTSCELNQYTRIVRDLKQFAIDSGVQEFFFHTVYERDPDHNATRMDDPAATALLTQLALAGNGAMFRFPGGTKCDVTLGDSSGCLFSKINLDSTQAVFERRQMIVSNRNALPTARGLEVDSDADGLSDREEREIGTDPTIADTDGDLLNDRLEHLLRRVGLDPLVHTTTTSWPAECPLPGGTNPNGFPPEQDQDGDRLTDCEEILLRANPTLYDTDADGIPDPLEFRMGTNGISDDSLIDTDADGLVNIDEYRLHLDPLARDPNTDRTYDYEFANEEEQSVMAFTQPLVVTGVTIFSTSKDSHEGRGTIFYTPPPDPTQPVSASNPASLSWRDPQDDTPSGTELGRGPEVPITGDARLTLQSAGSLVGQDMGELSVVVDVAAYLLPTLQTKSDVRLRRSTRFCFDFRVSNVLLVKTSTLPDQPIPGINYVDLFLGEVPSNNPASYGIFRVATVPLEYPKDPNERTIRPDIELIDQDFLLFGD